MIQRIQSLFLLFAALTVLSLFKVPFAMSNTATEPFFEDTILTSGDHLVLIILTALAASMALFSIFKYNNRLLQLRLGYIGIICSLFLAIVAFWLLYTHTEAMADIQIEDQIGLYFPFASILLFFLANHFIKKDEKTVRSMDRLR